MSHQSHTRLLLPSIPANDRPQLFYPQCTLLRWCRKMTVNGSQKSQKWGEIPKHSDISHSRSIWSIWRSWSLGWSHENWPDVQRAGGKRKRLKRFNNGNPSPLRMIDSCSLLGNCTKRWLWFGHSGRPALMKHRQNLLSTLFCLNYNGDLLKVSFKPQPNKDDTPCIKMCFSCAAKCLQCFTEMININRRTWRHTVVLLTTQTAHF